ncbi:hypothetical protein Btru_032190 [Bulinus truncatus]|nr:hypothetical protein Btru_032190 [Bulinus truncatus]
MASPNRAMDHYPRNMHNGHARQGSHAVSSGHHPANRELTHYQRKTSQIYPEKAVVPHRPRPGPEEAEVNSPKVYQNANALEKYQKQEKHLVRQGKNAAAVDQLFENDLHNINYTKPATPKDKHAAEVLPNGMIAQPPATSNHTYIRRYLNLKVHYEEPKSRHSAVTESDNSSLNTAFDPMKDRHMWTMWRTAVNGRIVDEVRKLERIKSEKGSEASVQLDSSSPGVYGKAIVVPPLKRFIKLQRSGKEPAHQIDPNSGHGNLLTDHALLVSTSLCCKFILYLDYIERTELLQAKQSLIDEFIFSITRDLNGVGDILLYISEWCLRHSAVRSEWCWRHSAVHI